MEKEKAKEKEEAKERIFILDKAGSVNFKNPKGGRIIKEKGGVVKTTDKRLILLLRKHFFTEIIDTTEGAEELKSPDKEGGEDK